MNRTQAIVFFGILIAGLGISAFTLSQCRPERVEVTTTDPKAVPGNTDPIPAPPGTPEVPKNNPDPANPGTPATPSNAQGFKSPEALMGALVDAVRKRDVDGFLAMAGPDAVSPAVRPQLENLMKDPAWAPQVNKPVSELAKMPDSVRWAIHFNRQAAPAAPGAPVNPTPTPLTTEVFADLVVSADKTAWSVKKIGLPVDFASKTGMPAAVPQPGAPTDPAKVPAIDSTDALTVAHAFSQALVARNFDLARQLTDKGKVTDERVAALMIAIEEGAFRLREDKPLVVTLARNDLTWVLTRVNSEAAAAEFAMDLAKPVGTEDWKVQGLTFSKLIAALAQGAGAGGVAYAPLVADPQGGDSLVLYFEFNADAVSPRTARQLRIVADILKQDAKRKIEINGHADAKGSDGYNENLSNRRTAAIRAQLASFGVAPEQVVTRAFGEARPLRPNFNPDGTDNPDNRSQNRRAEVYLDF